MLMPYPLAFCQAGIEYHHPRVRTLNHVNVIKHLLSILRDKETKADEFRRTADRVIRLLIEELVSMHLASPTKKKSPTG